MKFILERKYRPLPQDRPGARSEASGCPSADKCPFPMPGDRLLAENKPTGFEAYMRQFCRELLAVARLLARQ